MRGVHRALPKQAFLLLSLAISGCSCGGDGGGDSGPPDGGCFDPPPAPSTTCMAAQFLGGTGPAAPGPDGLGGEGDLEVTSDVLRAVFSAVDRASGVAPTGGTLIDLHLLGRSDHMNELSQLGGLAQGMRVAYTSLTLAESTPARVVVRASGHVAPAAPTGGEDPLVTPDPGTDLTFVTDYEITCGTPIVVIRSTLRNEGSVSYATNPAFGVVDVMLWGTRSLVPFCPVRGQGDRCPPFDLANPIASIVGTPFFGALGSLDGDPGSFAFYSPTALTLLGVHDPQVSSFGRLSFTDSVLGPTHTRTYERAIAVGDRADVASALDPIFDDLAVRGLRDIGIVRGRVTLPAGETISSDPRRRPMVVLATPGTGGSIDPLDWTPHTMVRVEADGTFESRVPAGTIAYEVRLEGHPVLRADSGQAASCPATDLGDLAVPAAPTMRVEVRDVSGTPVGLPARVIVYGAGATPDPDFGPAAGGSPAANVAYTDGDGLVELRLPGGTYEVFATHGPFHSLGHAASVTVDPVDGADVQLDLVPMDVVPAGWVSADFHVHSAASFDSSLPVEDRVRAFIAEGVQAIVATEHDVLFDYAPALTAVEATLPPAWRGRLRTFVGVESTGSVPTSRYAHTIGHHNAFPLIVQAAEHGAGAPRDEGVDVGTLYEGLRAIPSPADVLVQLNHGRSSRAGDVWLGYFDSCAFDPTAMFDAPVNALCFDMPGAMGTNAYEFDAMEVINGRDAISHVRMLHDWLSLLRQSPEGIRPIGTANSDSHELVLETAGYPMTLLRTATPLASLDESALVAALGSGAVTGSLGVVIEAEATGNAGAIGPGGTVAGTPLGLRVRVTAAPWIPVDQIRVRLGGELLPPITPTFTPTDPYSTTASVVRYDDTIILTPNLPMSGDTFITVEAGFALAAVTDDDGDGVVDVEAADVGSVPLPFGRVVRDARPIAFTNPIYVDVDDGGYAAPGDPLPP